jgi:hypothetical protein
LSSDYSFSSYPPSNGSLGENQVRHYRTWVTKGLHMNEHQLDMLSVLLGNPDSVIHTPPFNSQKDFIIRQLLEHRHFCRLDISLHNNRTYSEMRMNRVI